MGECFWEPSSVVGLTKVCTGSGGGGARVLSFIPKPTESGYRPSNGSGYGMFYLSSPPFWEPEFSAAMYSGLPIAVTGLHFIRHFDPEAAGDTDLGLLGDPLPDSVTFTEVNYPVPYACSGCVYEGFLGFPAKDRGQSRSHYYGRVDIGGQLFYGLFAVGSGV